jgi:hypothetical protein
MLPARSDFELLLTVVSCLKAIHELSITIAAKIKGTKSHATAARATPRSAALFLKSGVAGFKKLLAGPASPYSGHAS